MKTEQLMIGRIPAVLYGDPADAVYLFLHGQMGCKEEAGAFARTACPRGFQVLSIDLPGHGARQERAEELTPWSAVPDIRQAAGWALDRWQSLSLRANSIGAYFAGLSIPDPAKALLVSPVLDMERLIRSMMQRAGVTEELLQEQGEIHTSFGQTLSWRYLRWVREHPVSRWDCPIHILYANRDNMTSRATVEAYARRSHAQLTVVDGEHWFHTPEQLAALQNWEERVT